MKNLLQDYMSKTHPLQQCPSFHSTENIVKIMINMSDHMFNFLAPFYNILML